ncbi:MAG: DUF350 domain-containing protein [Acidobacteriota bacterium]|nr:MAG: DUF350 domain-containing protein [Acidobacteriota bacterium]
MTLLNAGAPALVVRLDQLYETLITTLIFVVIGLVFFAISFFILDKAMPYSIHKEIEEDQNTALGIIIGAMMLGIALIIAAAIHG